MSAPPLLGLAGVHTHIGAYHILHGVDFQVPAGEVTMLLGRNGAGKTTTLRTIMGLWAASLWLLSAPKVAAPWVRIAGAIAGVLFFVVALQLFMGRGLTPLSQPLPFFAYPFFVAALLGWAWERFRSNAD